jgi:hypothetical protein
MTVARVIARSLEIANVVGSTVLATTEQDSSINAAYRDVYEKIMDANDDYFVTDWAFTLAQMTAVSTETGAYYIALPDGALYSAIAKFYRLRALEYQRDGKWYAVRKYALQDNQKRLGIPVYRFKGSNLYILFPESVAFSNLRAWYYPVPKTYAVASGTEDIVYPPQLEAEILSYQIALDIKRKQGGDIQQYQLIEKRRDELWTRYENALRHRDDWGTQTVANVYQTTSGVI